MGTHPIFESDFDCLTVSDIMSESDEKITPESISERLQDMNRYNPDNQGILEEYVFQQVHEGTYDLDENMALLKLYQFYPHQTRHEIIVYVLLKALMNLPNHDFVLYKSLLTTLLDEDKDKNVKRVLEIHKMLEQCRFAQFWTEIQTDHDLVERLVGFEDAIRTYISGIIANSFQRLSRDNVKEFLGMNKEAEINSWIERNGWTGDQGVVFIASQEEKVKSKSIVEKLDLSGLVPVMTLGAKCNTIKVNERRS